MRYRILDLLYEQGRSFLSGQEICEKLGISRNAVWKHIKTLTGEGYSIKGERGKGYFLDAPSDILNEYEVRRNLGFDIPVFYSHTMDSTNSMAKKLAGEVESGISLVVCSVQEAGRGRMGRNFESANEKGVWCSFLLKPEIEPRQALIITLASAVAVCMTIEGLYGVRPGIKWPNDVILKGRKICGILSEMNCETNLINYIVVGIGINVLQDSNDFSAKTRGIASSLYELTGTAVSRSKIIAGLCYNIQEMYGYILDRRTDRIMELWNKYNVTDGREITLVRGNERINAVAEGIDEGGRLAVKLSDGSTALYNSGEISLRGITDSGGKEK